MSIADTYRKIRKNVPDHVTIVLACKKRTPDEVLEVIEAGATDLGENYVQEAEQMIASLGEAALRVRWHMIGPLQKNKINKALRLFDTVQTVHSLKQAGELDKRAGAIGKELSVCMEINSGRETAKSGVEPDYETVRELAEGISTLEHLRLEGLMTMGPFLDPPEQIRPFFRTTRELFDRLRETEIPNVDMKYLSMGMTDSYPVAIEEGSNMIRLGTGIFGPRPV